MTSTTSTTYRITPQGDFSLQASIDFVTGFTPLFDAKNGGTTPDADADPVLRLAFGVERHTLSVGVAVRQGLSGVVLAEATAPDGAALPADDVLRGQIARILSLDVDASALEAALTGDEPALDLATRLRGLRPVCFNSPYEAAAWAVLSQRVQMTQAARVRARIAMALGTTHQVAGQDVAAFPPPDVLLASGALPGLVPEIKVHRLQAVARAAQDGLLDGERLRTMDQDDAIASLLTIDGVGPFSADLILVRGAGHPDRFPLHEKRLHQEMSSVYGVPDDDAGQLATIAERWRPFRSWVSFYFRTQASSRSLPG